MERSLLSGLSIFLISILTMSRPVAGSNVGTSMPPRASVDMRNDQDHFLTEAKGVKVTAADRQVSTAVSGASLTLVC